MESIRICISSSVRADSSFGLHFRCQEFSPLFEYPSGFSALKEGGLPSLYSLAKTGCCSGTISSQSSPSILDSNPHQDLYPLSLLWSTGCRTVAFLFSFFQLPRKYCRGGVSSIAASRFLIGNTMCIPTECSAPYFSFTPPEFER